MKNLIKRLSNAADALVERVYRKRFAKYLRMLQYGKIKELIEMGKSDFVISHFEEFRLGRKPHTDKDAYAPYAMLVSVEDMRSYLRHDPENFFFFTMHPLGLQVLAEEGFSGVIARLENEFIGIAKNFPKSFMLEPDSKKKYIETVNNYLETNFPVW